MSGNNGLNQISHHILPGCVFALKQFVAHIALIRMMRQLGLIDVNFLIHICHLLTYGIKIIVVK